MAEVHKTVDDGTAASAARRRRWAAIGRAVAVIVALPATVAGCIGRGINPIDLLGVPKTIVERVVEARNGRDIVLDNDIVIAANLILFDLDVIGEVGLDIYEQRLLVTGLLEDETRHERLRARIAAIKGIRELYWHVTLVTANEHPTNGERRLDWGESLWVDIKAGLRLFGSSDVADVNFRVAADALGKVYLLGRARSQEELNAALAAVGATEGARGVVSYVEVRP